jgi:hypothetical protein
MLLRDGTVNIILRLVQMAEELHRTETEDGEKARKT